jgi:glycosyltransferase involved in cell wall biosynthesis
MLTLSDVPGMSTDQQPEVSVVMPVFNAERFLPGTVDSVLGQTFTNLELVAVDDGSTDRSIDILQGFATKDARVRVIVRAHTGIAGARNDGIAAARGEFVAAMDNDDVMCPERLALQVSFLRRHPDYVAVGAAAMLVDEDGDPLNVRRFPTSSEEIEAELLAGKNPLMQSNCLFRRDTLVKMGGYRDRCNFAEDYDLFLRLSEHGRLGNLDEVLAQFRQHVSRASASYYRQQNQVAVAALQEAYERRGIQRELPKIEGSWHPTTKRGYHLRCASDAWDGGHVQTVRKHAIALWRESRFSMRAIELYSRTLMGRRMYAVVEKIKAMFRPLKLLLLSHGTLRRAEHGGNGFRAPAVSDERSESAHAPPRI